MIENLNLYGVFDFDAQCQRLVAHVGTLLKAGEVARVRGIVEVLKPFNRSAHDAVILAYAVHINNVMASEPTPTSTK